MEYACSVGGDREEVGVSDAMLRAICDAAAEAIVIMQEEGVILSANAAGAAMFGYTQQELVGRPVLELTTPDWREMIRDSYQTRREHTYEAIGLRKDGTTFRGKVRTRNVDVGGRRLRAVIIRDFSEQDQLERDLSSTVSLLRATLEATNEGILVVDRAGVIVLYNEAFVRIWGLSEAEMRIDRRTVIDICSRQVVDPRTFHARIEALFHAPDEEASDVLEFHDGRVIERYTRPQRVGDRITGRVYSFRDITHQREAARSLELAVQMRDEFLAIASHELFTPLTSLAVAIRGLRDTTKHAADGPGARLVSSAERQVARVTRLVQELLDVTRIDGGRMTLTREQVELGGLVRDVLARFQPELDRDGIVVQLEAAGPAIGPWDRSRLEQVVTNLLGNAIKFGQGKPIEIKIGMCEVGAELSVRDHGIGVAPEQKALIFERFQRAVSSRHFAGLGLGLYITRQIVEAHGGRLDLTSTPGQGATFRVGLPVVGGT
jgi:PAS domain S-box-containing protein